MLQNGARSCHRSFLALRPPHYSPLTWRHVTAKNFLGLFLELFAMDLSRSTLRLALHAVAFFFRPFQRHQRIPEITGTEENDKALQPHGDAREKRDD